MTELWGTKEVARYLKIPVQTLYQWRTKNYGPPGRRVGKHIRYEPEDVREWFKIQPREVA